MGRINPRPLLNESWKQAGDGGDGIDRLLRPVMAPEIGFGFFYLF